MKNATLNWLREQCIQNLLAEKWLLCDSLRSGQTWKDRINLAGTATVNLHSKTLRSIVLSLVGQQLAEQRLVYLNHVGSESLLLDLFVTESEAGRLRYFKEPQHAKGLAKLIARSIRDLRLAGIAPSELVSDDFEVSAKAADLSLIYERYMESLAQRSLVDYSSCLELATHGLDASLIPLAPELMVLQPHRIDWSRREQQFLDSLRTSTNFVCTKQLQDADLGSKLREIRPKFFAGYGEINEVRAVFQRVLANDASSKPCLDDVEIAYTQESYVPLILEFLQEYAPADPSSASPMPTGLPVTFSEGIAAIYSRPGRALRAWLRWIQSDGLQSKAVQLFREGILNRPEDSNDSPPIGYSRLASNLRRISIGFKLERYLPAIEAAITKAKKLQREFINRRDNDEGEEDRAATSHDDEVPRDYGLPALLSILEMATPLVELAPPSSDVAKDVLKKAKQFLLRCARCENKLDRYVRSKLLDEIDGRITALDFTKESAEGAIAWLENLPVETSVLGNGPRPGCVYATPVGKAGHSGRTLVFLVGMDASRFPMISRVDPLLLDSERKAISVELETSAQLANRSEKQILLALQRISQSPDVKLAFSFSTRNLVEDRDQAPSPALVELFRQSCGLPEAGMNDLLNHIGTPTSFASTDPDNWLRESDGELAEFLTSPNGEGAQAHLEMQYPHFAAARLADEQRESTDFTEFDGLVPEAGPSLSPTNSESRVSPSRLETFGTCPRRFFFKYGLGAYPPDEWNIDPERWLDPINLGNLIHGLFETFMRELTSDDRSPEAKRDLPRLLELLSEHIDAYLADIPIPNEDAFQRQKEWLEECCEIFLEKEQAYCQETGAKPWVLEAAIGLDEDPVSDLDCREPIALGLKNGELIRVGGRIDRIDRLATDGSESYAIWDYKSGSDWGFSQDDPFKQGRKLQSFLYVGMLRHRLAATGGNKDAATSFGYFFPNAKTQGKRIQWTAGDLKKGDGILQNICTLIQQGAFPATTERKDCTYCDYNSVCAEAQIVTADSIRITRESRNRGALGLWKELREL